MEMEKTSQYVKIWILTFVLNLILVSIFTPNNSNIDWGSRYLTCSVFIPLLLLSEIKISMNIFWSFRKNSKFKKTYENKVELPKIENIEIKENYKKIILFGLLILILYSISVNFKMIQLMRKISIQLSEIQSEIPWDNSKIFITSKSNIANTFGLNYFSQTILLIKNQRI
ncbi:putative membrane protein [Leptospira interrogans]|nr:putative membrane protein [Leptospira interrogans]